MILSDVLNRIKFKVGSMDDIQSKSVNPLVSTSNIIYELNAQMNEYAKYTYGLQDIYSVPVTSNDQFIDGAPLALRSQAYKYAYLITRGWAQPLDIRGQRDITPVFHGLTIRSVGGWMMVMNEVNKQRIFLHPMAGASYNTTTLTAGITSSDTTIPVTATGSFINTGGRITIDNEKILYEYKDATNFYGCVRGLEMTTAASHSNVATVKENNLVINYSRLPQPLTVTDTPSSDDLAAEVEIVDDHIEGVCNKTAVPLLIKIDPARATAIKLEADKQFEQYKLDISKGYGRNRQGVDVRQPYINENGLPLVASNNY